MGTAAVFSRCLEAFPALQHAIAIDLPGAGESDRGLGVSLTLEALARVVCDAMDALGLRAPVLVGHSHGGAVALYLAASEPGRVRGLVLLAPAHPYFRHADPLIAFYLSPPGRAFAHTLPWYPAWVQMIGLRLMAGPQSHDTRERLTPYRENLRTPGTIGSLLRLLGTWQPDMQSLRLLIETPVQAPILLIWGDHDRVVPASTAVELRRRLGHATLHMLTGVGHRPAEEQPALCAALITAWLEPQAQRPGEPGQPS